GGENQHRIMVDKMGRVNEADYPAGAVHGQNPGRIQVRKEVIRGCPDGMPPMNIAEKPIAAIIGRLTSTGDGIHMIANSYQKGHRIDTHTHREAQLVYAARGTMQVTTPKGRWLVPPDRAVWV